MLLNAHTYYSYKYGTQKPATLLQNAIHFGYDHIFITDINNTSAALECMRLCKEESLQIRAKPGIDFRNGAKQLFVALPINNAGFLEVNAYLSRFLHEKTEIPPLAPTWQNAFVIYPLNNVPECNQLHDKQFVGIAPHEVHKFSFSKASKWKNRAVIMATVSFNGKKDFNAHRLLRAMDNNLLLSKLPDTEVGDPRHEMIPKTDLIGRFSQFPEAIKNTQSICEQCEVDFEFGSNKNKRFFTDSLPNDMALLRAQSMKGLTYRYGTASNVVLDRIEHELRVIQQKDFASYFLINWDIVNYARSRGYFHVGRGSGANSLIAYLLRITDVDPVELDLYFERFINPHRASPPDFDIDFSWLDRNDVTAYIFEKHGREKVALQATYSTLQPKAVSREIGKVLGVPPSEIEQVQKLGAMHRIGHYGDLMIKYSSLVEGFPGHLSIHSSGILISELPINAYSPTFLPPKGFPTVQFDMITAEDIGLHKFDILSQRGLGKIRDSIEIVKQNTGQKVDVHDINAFKKDERIKTLLREARAIGCFYVESPAMRLLLTKLRADDYLSLVAASSVIRPGVAKSGMMREFIERFRDINRRKAAQNQAPELYEILKETYGVMVYQEDVIKVAHLFGGLNLAEADVLRRGMSWKFKQRSEFHLVKQRFFENCASKGYAQHTVAKVWSEIESFANFAFAKGHSASYAVESYQTLFLKAYYPIEYMVATVNNGGGFYRAEIYLHEARMNGAVVEAPCINNSEKQCVLNGKTITLGLEMIRDLDTRSIEAILNARKSNDFESLMDFIDRVQIGIEQLELLIKIGAFRKTGRNKKELMWEARLRLGKSKPPAIQPKLFDSKAKTFVFPDLYTAPLEDAFDQLELLGFPLCSPFDLANQPIKNDCTAIEIPTKKGCKIIITGYLVTARRTYTANGDEMWFGNFIDKYGHFIDTVHFPIIAKKYRFSGRGLYEIKGKVTEDHGCFQIEVETMHRIPYVDDPRYSDEKPRSSNIQTLNDNKNARYFPKLKKPTG